MRLSLSFFYKFLQGLLKQLDAYGILARLQKMYPFMQAVTYTLSGRRNAT